MNAAYLEHINLTVPDAKRTASMLTQLFDWSIRWQGESIHNGYTIHVGAEHSYIALFTHDKQMENQEESYFRHLGLNHLGVVVNDLDATEKRVIDAGFKTHSHGDYEPGRRFYFHDHDNLEIEVISYAT